MEIKLIMAAASGLALGFAAGWLWLRRQWSRPLDEIERLLGQWAVGDFNESIKAQRLGPAGRLTTALERTRAEQWRAFNEGLRAVTLERLRLEAALRQIPEGVVICNLRGDILRANPAAARLLGVPDEDDPAGSNTFEARAVIQRVLKAHMSSELVELSHPAWPEAAAYVDVSVIPLGAEDPIVVLVLRDAASQRRLDRLKEDFFHSVAEQLRAPVSAMQGYLKLLGVAGQEKRQDKYVQAMSRWCSELSLLLQDSLDAALMDSGQMRLSAMPIDPAALLRRAAEPFAPRAQEKGVRIELKLAEDRPVSIDVDERLLGRVLQRLLTEAVEGTRRGGAVELGSAAVGSQLAQLWVATAPPAPAPAGAAAAFQAAAPKAALAAGEGPRCRDLCRRVARLHGGDFNVKAERWTVQLPVKQSPVIIRSEH